MLNTCWRNQSVQHLHFTHAQVADSLVACNITAPIQRLTRNYVALQSRLLFPPGDHKRLLVRSGSMRAAPEVRELSGIHGAAHPGQQEGVDEECGQLSGHQRHREEAGALLRFNAHKKAVFPAEKVAESDLGGKVCWFYLTALETMSTSGSVKIHLFFSFFFSSMYHRGNSMVQWSHVG